MRLHTRFNISIADNGPALFTTDAGPLFQSYLDAIPADKQHYNCHACRHFIDRFGSLAVIDESGKMLPAMWRPDDAIGFCSPVVLALHNKVARSNVTGVFLYSHSTLGTPKTGEWSHMAAYLPQGLIHSH